MSKKNRPQRLETIAFLSATPAIEATFVAAARSAFGELAVEHVDGNGKPPAAAVLERALLVLGHPEMAQGVVALRDLRARGARGPALLVAAADSGEVEAELAELGPAAAFPAEGFAPEDLRSCVGALDPTALPSAGNGAQTAEPAAAAAAPAIGEPADGDDAASAADEDAGLSQAEALASIDADESALLQSIEALRQSRRKQVEAIGKAARTAQRRLEATKKRLAKTQESLSVEKRQRWEVVLDLRESQERIKEVEERLQKAREGETRRQKDLDALRLDLEQRTQTLVSTTRERDAAQQRLEQAQKGLEKKSDQSRARIEELREESDRLREEHAKTLRELEDRAAGLELELEESRRETGIRAAELQSIATQRRSLETDLLEARETAARDREQAVARAAALEDDGRKLRHRLETLAQTEGGRVAQLESERKATMESLERRTEELSKALATSGGLEKELNQLRAQYQKEREESQAWIAELEREVEKVRTEHTTLAREREGELELLRGQFDAARGELESARSDLSKSSSALIEAESSQASLGQQLAELGTRLAQEREEAQVRTTKLQEERDRLDARLRRSSADSGKVSDMQKEIDTLLAELADKEESCVALRTGQESLERDLEEARGALSRDQEEAAGRLSALVAERSDLERQLQESHEHRQTLERQMASLRAEVVELEVAREEYADRMRELDARDSGAAQKRAGDDLHEERDRLKKELDAMRVDAENTRRALADSDARLRKLQQEKSAARAEPREKAGDLAIQQLRADLGSLGD